MKAVSTDSARRRAGRAECKAGHVAPEVTDVSGNSVVTAPGYLLSRWALGTAAGALLVLAGGASQHPIATSQTTNVGPHTTSVAVTAADIITQTILSPGSGGGGCGPDSSHKNCPGG
jgi:hypothetical protein